MFAASSACWARHSESALSTSKNASRSASVANPPGGTIRETSSGYWLIAPDSASITTPIIPPNTRLPTLKSSKLASINAGEQVRALGGFRILAAQSAVGGRFSGLVVLALCVLGKGIKERIPGRFALEPFRRQRKGDTVGILVVGA
tara:strand:- start:9687 stop:10124 length:438 start_codon:yes stop_codon:yes gene_type:complete